MVITLFFPIMKNTKRIFKPLTLSRSVYQQLKTINSNIKLRASKCSDSVMFKTPRLGELTSLIHKLIKYRNEK